MTFCKQIRKKDSVSHGQSLLSEIKTEKTRRKKPKITQSIKSFTNWFMISIEIFIASLFSFQLFFKTEKHKNFHSYKKLFLIFLFYTIFFSCFFSYCVAGFSFPFFMKIYFFWCCSIFMFVCCFFVWEICCSTHTHISRKGNGTQQISVCLVSGKIVG